MNESKRFLFSVLVDNQRSIFVRLPKDPDEVEFELLDYCTSIGRLWINSITDEMIIEFRFDSFEEKTRADIEKLQAEAILALIKCGWLETNGKIQECSMAFWSAFEKV